MASEFATFRTQFWAAIAYNWHSVSYLIYIDGSRETDGKLASGERASEATRTHSNSKIMTHSIQNNKTAVYKASLYRKR